MAERRADVIHPGEHGPAVQCCQEIIQGGFIALGNGFHAAVHLVFNVTTKAELARLVPHEIAVTYALHAAGDRCFESSHKNGDRPGKKIMQQGFKRNSEYSVG